MTAPRRAFVCSWDDGHPLDLKLAELLLRHGLRGTFFVPRRNREGLPVMGAPALRELHGQGFEIGSHTLDHVRLRPLRPAAARRQVRDGHDHVEQVLGRACNGFCYPGGSVPRAPETLFEGLSIGYARTVENLRFDLAWSRWHMPTGWQVYPHGRGTLLKNTVRKPTAWPAKLAAIHRLPAARPAPGGLPGLPGLLAGTPASARVLHLWGHSWEIERLNLWAALDRLLGEVAQAGFESLTLSELAQHARHPADIGS